MKSRIQEVSNLEYNSQCRYSGLSLYSSGVYAFRFLETTPT